LQTPTIGVPQINVGSASDFDQVGTSLGLDPFLRDVVVGFLGVGDFKRDVVDAYGLLAGYGVDLDDRLVWPGKLELSGAAVVGGAHQYLETQLFLEINMFVHVSDN
jgi:hypothetical protein